MSTRDPLAQYAEVVDEVERLHEEKAGLYALEQLQRADAWSQAMANGFNVTERNRMADHAVAHLVGEVAKVDAKLSGLYAHLRYLDHVLLDRRAFAGGVDPPEVG